VVLPPVPFPPPGGMVLVVESPRPAARAVAAAAVGRPAPVDEADVLVLSEELVDEELVEAAPVWRELTLVVEPPTVVAAEAPVEVVFLMVVVVLATVVAVALAVVTVALAVVVVAGFAVVVVAGLAVVVVAGLATVVGGLQWHPGAHA
jgi:hypothetical protein